MATISSKTIRGLAMVEIRGENDLFEAIPLSCTEKEKYDACVRVATEQDRIARQEERERCIKAAQDAHCVLCKYYDGIGNVCTSFYECNEREMIRKTMEGGEK